MADVPHPPFVYTPGPAIRSFGATVFAEFGLLAAKHSSVNLAQGAPDFDSPDFVLKAAHTALGKQQNQYSRPAGHIPLVNALSKLYSGAMGRTIDAIHEIIVTVGASEAIFACVQSVVGPGDEVVMVEPVFDPIKAAVIMCGATPRFIPLRTRPDAKITTTLDSDSLYIDCAELEGLIRPNTKLLIINSPHNPTGKVFSRSELESIAAVVRKHPHLCVVSDEVYEFLTFDNAIHEKFATIPGMWERTLTLGSASKTFSITGWRVGWAIGPKELVQGVLFVHQYIPFCTCSITQDAVAQAFEEAPSHDYYPFLKELYQKKRDHLVESLEAVGLKPVVPKGSYFVVADIQDVVVPESETLTHEKDHRHDYNVCRYLTSVIGVAALPMSAFYSDENKHIGQRYARFAFCKTDEVLEAARTKLNKIKELNIVRKPN
jgi:aspartate/methionine/tyrosine aminotransferase